MNPRLLVLGALLASVAFATGAAPARASDDAIGLSADGVTWGHALSSPLFTRNHVWVPGDLEVRSFYVRNDGPTGARMLVSLRTQDGDHLISDDDVVLSARAAGGRWRSVDNGGDVTPLVRGALAQGEAVRVDLRALFRWRSTNESMVDQVPLRIEVTLRQDTSAQVGDGTLPGVGSNVSWWLLASAVASILGGVALVAVARGRRRDEQA
ncbi:hypothetical protein [Nocardioides humilatus]|uniref:hypothetical protein n=1 Tax=Nocardioides humilatus TaxID=2607660 RepID=UPI001CB6D593|nr:hypothetical protein [Nocardioides humilatus]